MGLALVHFQKYWLFIGKKIFSQITILKFLSDFLGSGAQEESSSDEGPKNINLPKIVAIGLQGVFEIIRESQNQFPSICRRALESLSGLWFLHYFFFFCMYSSFFTNDQIFIFCPYLLIKNVRLKTCQTKPLLHCGRKTRV